MSIFGATWHVRSDAPSGGDGVSWGTAFASIQRAIDHASAGDEIWISGGEYRPENVRDVVGEQCFASSFELKDGVSLFGGFCGDEASPVQRRRRLDGVYAWDFISETVLLQRGESLGGVVIASQPLERGVELNGLTLSGGRALGQGGDGRGGGLFGSGRICVRLCKIAGNSSWEGGGIYWTGPMLVEDSCCLDNDVSGGGGSGGGCSLHGEGFCLRRVLIAGNGRCGCPSAGGGVFADGAGRIDLCTVCRNGAARASSGVWLGGGAAMANCIVWGNTGAMPQVSLEDGGTCVHTAVEGIALPGKGNWPLAHENAGSGGCDANDNRPGWYYACFRQPSSGDFRLGRGAYALKRGLGGRCLDLGACQTDYPGNLAVVLDVGSPVLYGESSPVNAAWGAASPGGCGVDLSFDGAVAAVSHLPAGGWKTVWKRAGRTELALAVKAPAGWNSVKIRHVIDVLPRPLNLAADDVCGDSPEITWYVEGGRLVGTDRVVGAVSPGPPKEPNGCRAIQRGTLRVEDGNNGKNYTVRFHEGLLAD